MQIFMIKGLLDSFVANKAYKEIDFHFKNKKEFQANLSIVWSRRNHQKEKSRKPYLHVIIKILFRKHFFFYKRNHIPTRILRIHQFFI